MLRLHRVQTTGIRCQKLGFCNGLLSLQPVRVRTVRLRTPFTYPGFLGGSCVERVPCDRPHLIYLLLLQKQLNDCGIYALRCLSAKVATHLRRPLSTTDVLLASLALLGTRRGMFTRR